jgi:hypothetical protein
MNFEKTQRIDSGAAAFADGGALCGLSNRHFFKHGG